MPTENIHFPVDLEDYSKSFKRVRCLLMRGGNSKEHRVIETMAT
jgi:hypothetical protein